MEEISITFRKKSILRLYTSKGILQRSTQMKLAVTTDNAETQTSIFRSAAYETIMAAG